MAALGSLPCTFGRYRLLERIGGGGMAVVFRGTLLAGDGFEKEVAVKVVREELAADAQFTEMFLDEARLAARLSHANVVQTFDFGQVDGTYFLAMEYVRGRTLAGLQRVCRARHMSLGAARSLHVAAQVARGLAHAHRLTGADGALLGLVHRDVSPQNVLVSREGEVKLADFGIAKAALRSHVTQPGKIRGKCSYMSPEQARGQTLDARSDIFSLGIVLWESITSATLFDGPSELSVLEQVIKKDIPAPSRLVPDLPPEVDEVVLRLLARDPDARPASADVVARELGDHAVRLAGSQGELDLGEFQRRLASGTQNDAVPWAQPAAAMPAPAPAAAVDLGAATLVRGENSGDDEATVLTRLGTTAPARPAAPTPRRFVAGLAGAVLALSLLAALRLGLHGRESASAPPASAPPAPPPAVVAVPPPPAPIAVAPVASTVEPAREAAPHLPAAEHARQGRAVKPREEAAPPRTVAVAPAELVLSARAEATVRLDGGEPRRLSQFPLRVATTAGRHTLRFEAPGVRCSVRLSVGADDHAALLLESDGAVFRLSGARRTSLGCR